MYMGKTGPKQKLNEEQIASLYHQYKTDRYLSVYALGKRVCIGDSTLDRYFKKYFGESYRSTDKQRLLKLKPSEIEEICKLYRDGEPIKNIADKFRIDKSTVLDHIKKNGFKVRLPGGQIKYELPDSAKTMTKEKAYILGVMCGDGSVYKNKQNSRKIVLSVSDKDFATEFARCLKTVYGIEPIVSEAKRHWPEGKNWSNAWEARIFSKQAYEDILSYDSFKTESWKVPEIIFQSSVEIKTSFLRGFFDSEGCVSFRRIRAVSINSDGTNQIGDILKSLNIKYRIKCKQKEKSNWQDQKIVDITGIQNLRTYKDLIGFSIRRKQEKLSIMLNNYQKTQKTHEEVLELKEKMFELRKQNLSYPQISKQLGIGVNTVWMYINNKHKTTEPNVQLFSEKE